MHRQYFFYFVIISCFGACDGDTGLYRLVDGGHQDTKRGILAALQGLVRDGVGLPGFNIRCNVRIQLSYRHFGNRASGVVTFF
ncbi:hypothetical protein GGI43DRAFT_371292 [Trichoderma evansii]